MDYAVRLVLLNNQDFSLNIQDFLRLQEPTVGLDLSWFGFAITIKPDSPLSRLDLIT